MEKQESKPVGRYDIDNPNALRNMALTALGTYAVFFIISLIFWSNSGDGRAGQFGDTFGFVNALFGGLTIAGIFYTIQLQRKELRETKEEFRIQSQVFQQQRFDEFFFYLLTLHQEKKNSLLGSTYYHMSAFSYIYYEIEKNVRWDLPVNEKGQRIIDAIAGIDAGCASKYRLYFNTFSNIVSQLRRKKEILGTDLPEYLFTLFSTMEADELRVLILYSTIQDQTTINNFKTTGFYEEDLINSVFLDDKYKDLLEIINEII